MPTINHETYCHNHSDESGVETCECESAAFGPLYEPTGYPAQPLGEMFAYRCLGDDGPTIVLDCGGRLHDAITMGPRELRTLRTLLERCPEELRAAVAAVADLVLEEAPA